MKKERPKKKTQNHSKNPWQNARTGVSGASFISMTGSKIRCGGLNLRDNGVKLAWCGTINYPRDKVRVRIVGDDCHNPGPKYA